jgi:hypothetical protein
MILYNVTVGIDADVEQEWLIWMIHEHVPKVMATEMFESYEIYKVLSHDAEGSSYSVQYKTTTMDRFDEYINNYAPVLIKEHMDRYKDKHVAFRTVLQKVG